MVPLVPLREFVQRMKNNQKTKAIKPRACTTDLEPKNYEMLNAMIMARINDSGKQSISYYPEINRTLRSGEAPGQGKTTTKGRQTTSGRKWMRVCRYSNETPHFTLGGCFGASIIWPRSYPVTSH